MTGARRTVKNAKSEIAPFAVFFRTHYADTVRLARLLSGSNTFAEDLAQDAFTRVQRHFGRLDNPAAYLRTTTVNTCRNWHRGRGREAANIRRLGSPQIALPPEAAELSDAIKALPYRQRAVLVLRFWLDLSEADIAAALGCRLGTVKSLQSRALATLRKELPR